eukprot:TRINITY_DN6449_c0_g2_i2.p1 TRINITY_DN6449_c0_g2~~TRINITY_DN6449_c0_g2_i2.p1  ORF type:complete len:816 (+),score=215.87 TRINITY_DN6449_c0_g2_i2:78-2450(+)
MAAGDPSPDPSPNPSPRRCQGSAAELASIDAARWVHSVSLASFDAVHGAQLTACFPRGIFAVPKAALSDFCFPDGAHDADEDTSFWAGGGGGLYGVACYRAVSCPDAARGVVQTGLLVLLTVPVLAPLGPVLQRLLGRWLRAHPHGGTSSAASAFAQAAFGGLARGLDAPRDLGTAARALLSFRLPAEAPAGGQAGTAEEESAEVSLPLLGCWAAPGREPCSVVDALAHGCTVKGLVERFNGRGTALIYDALLRRQSVLFVAGTSDAAGRMVLACAHLLRPALTARELVPYLSLAEAERRSADPSVFTIAGTTNPYVASQRCCGAWAHVLCDVGGGGAVRLRSGRQRLLRSASAASSRAAAGLRRGVPESWLRALFAAATARQLARRPSCDAAAQEPLGAAAEQAEAAMPLAEGAAAAAAERDAAHRALQAPLRLMLTRAAPGSAARDLIQKLLAAPPAAPDQSEAACASRTVEACRRQEAEDAGRMRRLRAECRERLLLCAAAMATQDVPLPCGAGAARRAQRADGMRPVLCHLAGVTVGRRLAAVPCSVWVGGPELQAAPAEILVAPTCFAIIGCWRRREGVAARLWRALVSGAASGPTSAEVIPYDEVDEVECDGGGALALQLASPSGTVGVRLSISCQHQSDTAALGAVMAALVYARHRVTGLLGPAAPAPAQGMAPEPLPVGLSEDEAALLARPCGTTGAGRRLSASCDSQGAAPAPAGGPRRRTLSPPERPLRASPAAAPPPPPAAEPAAPAPAPAPATDAGRRPAAPGQLPPTGGGGAAQVRC